jgi:GNAT superfamily N-acetyltransferase
MTASDLLIRLGEDRDVEALTVFNVAMAWETERRALDVPTVQAGVRSLLANPQAGFYVVAEDAGVVIACLMVTFEWSDWRNQVFWWIQSVYVVPAHRRRGVFTGLFQDVRARAAARQDVCGLRLYVEQHNRAAQDTYRSLGMAETHYDMYEVEL